VFGQSGGTGKISTLLAMPTSRGLVHKVIMQSGCALILRTPEQAERHTRSVLSHVPAWDGRSAASLRDVPVEHLLAAARAGGTRFGAFVDGHIVPRHPCEPDAPDSLRDVSLVIGCTTQEASYFYKKDMAVLSLTDIAEVRQRLVHRLGCDGPAAARFIELYRESRPNDTPVQLMLAIESDYMYRLRCIQYAERKAALGGAPVYMYLLDWQTPALGGLFGAPHTMCVPLVFRNQHLAAPLLGTGPDTQAISDRLCDAWMAFVRSGDPNAGAHGNGASLSRWQPYALPERSTMIFDRECRVDGDPLAEERKAMALNGPHANYISARREKFVRRPA